MAHIIEINTKTRDRFWSKVDKSGECWEWRGAISNGGYGRFMLSSKNCWQAHRLSFFLANGEIDPNMDICHKCDNRKCVNPDHLFQGTRSDNMRDASSKGRLYVQKNIGKTYQATKERCANGHMYLPDNLLVDGKGNRRCKKCTYESNRRSYARRRR